MIIGKKETVDSLVDRLKLYPYNSEGHQKLIKAISKRLVESNKYKDQNILSVPRGFSPLGFLPLNTMKDIYKILDTEKAFDPENENVKYRPRHLIEYDMNYQQIIVCGYVTDGQDYIILRKQNKLRQGTFIGGHVDFSFDAYNKSIDEFLVDNLTRELSEEVSIEGRWARKITAVNPIAYINLSTDDFYDQCNNGFVFEIQVDSVKNLKKLASGEPRNHDIISGNVEDILQKPTHSWVSLIFNHLQAPKEEE